MLCHEHQLEFGVDHSCHLRVYLLIWVYTAFACDLWVCDIRETYKS